MYIYLFTLSLWFCIAFPNATYEKSIGTNDIQQVQIFLVNKTILPKKRTFIIYRPNIPGNSTQVKWFLPFERWKICLPEGSKVYIASKQEIETVMQGSRIDDQPPFLEVKKENQKEKFKI